MLQRTGRGEEEFCLRGESISRLKLLLENGAHLESEAAAAELGWRRTEEAVCALLDASSSPHAIVRLLAIRELSWIDDERTIAATHKAAESDPSAEVAQAAKNALSQARDKYSISAQRTPLLNGAREIEIAARKARSNNVPQKPQWAGKRMRMLFSQ